MNDESPLNCSKCDASVSVYDASSDWVLWCGACVNHRVVYGEDKQKVIERWNRLVENDKAS